MVGQGACAIADFWGTDDARGPLAGETGSPTIDVRTWPAQTRDSCRGITCLSPARNADRANENLDMDGAGDYHDDMDKRANELVDAARTGDIAGVKAAISAGANVNLPDDRNGHALPRAAANGHAEVVGVLIAAGADAHTENEIALCWASGFGNAEVVRVLLTADANVHVDNDDPIFQAAAMGHVEVVRMLLVAGADPVIAWQKTEAAHRSAVAGTLDVCGDAMTAEHRAALVADSRLDEFVRLRIAIQSTTKNKALRR